MQGLAHARLESYMQAWFSCKPRKGTRARFIRDAVEIM